MTKKIVSWLSFMTVFLLALQSCRNDDLLSSPGKTASENALMKKGGSASLWKEDETYIRKVQEIYNKHADESYIRNTYGTVFWEYAMTMDTFNESYLVVPVLKDNKVVRTLEVFRVKNKIYFQFSDKDPEANDFFQALIFTEKDKISISSAGKNNAAGKGGTTVVSVCRTITLTVGYVEGANGDQYPISSTKTICKFVEVALPESDCLGDVNPETGECGGGGAEGGYDYPDAPDMTDPCEKIQSIGKDEKTKQLFENLKTKTASDREFGEVLVKKTSNVMINKPVEGEQGKGGINMDLSQPIDGFIHSHYQGLLSVFSAGDLASISGLYKNGLIKNKNTFIFGLVTASETQYIMVIDDPVAFDAFASQFLNSNGQIDVNYTDLYGFVDYHKYNIKEDNLADINELGFIKMLLEKNSGLKVLKGSNESKNWAKLSIQDEQIKTIPCN